MDTSAANLVEPGDRVLLVVTGYFSDRFQAMLERYGASVTRVEAPVGARPALDEVERALQAGSYKLLVFGQAGIGEQPETAGGPDLVVEVREGVMASTYFWWMIVLAALYPAKEILRKYSHEKRRIPSDDDDDDDD